jgi:membrane-associated phospholipid phosphatase
MRSRIRPEEALLALYGVALIVIMAATHHFMISNMMHKRFCFTFALLALLIWWRGYRRSRRAEPELTAAEHLRRALPPAVLAVRDFFPFLVVLVFYETLHDLTPLIRHDVVDPQLIAVDRALFGVDVSVWLDQFATPILTSVMVFCYLTYFFSPAILAALIYWSGRRQLFRDCLVSLSVVTFLGFSGYLIVPAVGPFVYQNQLFPHRLPGHGLAITELIISTVDQMRGFARDCFPSMHTAHTTVVLVFAWRFSRRLFLVYLPIALGLYVSTLYLRMHYAVDVAAGFAVAAIAVWIGPRLERWWYRDTANPAILEA